MFVAMTRTQLTGLLLAVWLVALGIGILLASPALAPAHRVLFWLCILYGVCTFVYFWRKLYFKPA